MSTIYDVFQLFLFSSPLTKNQIGHYERHKPSHTVTKNLTQQRIWDKIYFICGNCNSTRLIRLL